MDGAPQPFASDCLMNLSPIRHPATFEIRIPTIVMLAWLALLPNKATSGTAVVAGPSSNKPSPSSIKQSVAYRIVNVAEAKLIGRLRSTARLNLVIGLPVQNEADLKLLAKQICDKKSSNYRKYLSPAEFAVKFSPTSQDYENVIKFLRSKGFRVTKTFSNRLVLTVQGSVRKIEAAFHVKLMRYRRKDGRAFYAPDRKPWVCLKDSSAVRRRA